MILRNCSTTWQEMNEAIILCDCLMDLLAASFTSEWMETRPLERFPLCCYLYTSSKNGWCWEPLLQDWSIWTCMMDPQHKHYPLEKEADGKSKLRALLSENGQRVSPARPTWLQLCLVTGYTMGYCHPIHAGCDGISMVIACNWVHSISFEEERQRDLPSNLQLAVAEPCDSTLEDVSPDPQQMWWYGNCIAINIAYRWSASKLLKEVETKRQSSYQLGCDCALWRCIPRGIAIQSLLAVMTPSSLHIIKEHQHCSRRRGKGICQAIYSSLQLNFVTAYRRMCHPILDGCDGMAITLPSSLHIVEKHQHHSRK